MKKLTENHFCYFIFNEMTITQFQAFLETNAGGKYFNYLPISENLEFYEEAKTNILQQAFSFVQIEFPFVEFPFVFEKFIDGKFDRTYKICIFEINNEEREPSIKTSGVYCNGKPLFFDENKNLINPSNN